VIGALRQAPAIALPGGTVTPAHKKNTSAADKKSEYDSGHIFLEVFFERRARNIPLVGIASRLLAICCTSFSSSAMTKAPHCLDCGDCR
jgi:hypothetical protein